jgi:CheY-like chemotaxis protein
MTKKIVVAEDDEDILFILDMILNDAGYKVEPVSNGSSIVSGNKDWPDLFILDKDMPVIDGLAVCKYLKLNNATKDIPVIMISAYHKLRSKAKQAGVDEFIEKPFELKNLLQVIGKYIDIKPKNTVLDP